MTSRQSLKDTLEHRTPDHLVVDIGSTPVSGAHVLIVEKLRQHYGLEKRPVKAFEPYQMLGLIEEDLLDAIGVDVIGVHARNTMFGFPNKKWKEFRMPWGQVVMVSDGFNTKTDSNGDLLVYPEGDTSVKPSGRMPASGYFFDSIVRQEHFDENKLNAEDNMEEFKHLSEDDLDYYDVEVKRVKDSGRGVMANFGGTGLGDIALVTAPFLKDPKGIRDITEWYISTAIRQDYIHEIFSYQYNIALENFKTIYSKIGNSIDVVYICGTDLGTQSSSFCSVETFNSLYAPYYKKLNDWIHTNTKWKTFKHCCGSIKKFIPSFIECGFDILNPVQYSADDMDVQELKSEFGDDIVFWGGGIDTQKVLPFGTVDEVKTETIKQIDILSKNGGFVFNTVHNIQANTPIENVIAMFEVLQEHR